MYANNTAKINARFAAINFSYTQNENGYLVTNLATGKTKQFDCFLQDIIDGLEKVANLRAAGAEYIVVK